jgi:glycosyltransferase involved in cell wall biosynthesis
MDSPFFSIIIPTYNRAGFIGKTIDSFLKQTFEDFEIIVVDDGSTDNTKEIVSAFTDSRVKYYWKENAERGAARNYGAKIAQGKYLNFFDSDDIAYPNHLQEAFKLIEDYKNPEVFALGYDIINETRELIRKREPFKDINKQLIHGNLLSCNGVFILRDTALKHPFSEIRELSASEDYFLWLQLASKFKIYFKNTTTSAIIEHDNRSVLEINPEKLIKRKELMLQMAIQDQSIVNYYENKIKYLKANTYSYIALHLAMSNHKKQTLFYLKKTLKETPDFIFKRRFFAILKYMV